MIHYHCHILTSSTTGNLLSFTQSEGFTIVKTVGRYCNQEIEDPQICSELIKPDGDSFNNTKLVGGTNGEWQKTTYMILSNNYLQEAVRG